MERGVEGLEELRREGEKLLGSLFSTPPDEEDGLKVTSFGESSGQPVRYYIYADVLEELVKAARYREDAAAAVLVGQFSMDQKGPFIEVTAFEELRYLYGGEGNLFEMLRPAVENLFVELAEEEKGPRHVVGVFASRPESQALLEEEVARLHLSLFNMPFQLALVIDGREERLGCYARLPGEKFFNAAFCLVEAEDSLREAPPEEEETQIPDEIEA